MNVISLSVVTYKTSLVELDKVYDSVQKTNINWKLFVIDNSPTDELRSFAKKDSRIQYIFNDKNIGFGAAHNIAINLAIKENIKYHFVINPDVYFVEDVVSTMVKFMESGDRIGMVMPKVKNIDGSTQYLPKLLPSPLSVLLRKFKIPRGYYDKFINNYELRFVKENEIYDAPILSGCFTLFNIAALKEVGLYDDGYFMYFEDWDISRRMHEKYRTVYFPEVSIYHGYESGANKSSQLFKTFLRSGWRYFSKFGWFFDRDRRNINRKTLAQFK